MGPEAMGMATRQLQGNRQTAAAESVLACINCGESVVCARQVGAIVCPFCLLGMAVEPPDANLPSTEEGKPDEPSAGAPSLGPYVLVEEIGRGGMGVIYRAVHRETREVVAVKTVAPQEIHCPETLSRFQRETEAARSLVHPCSMPIKEVGISDEGVPYFSMELAAGGSLCQLMAKYHGRWAQIAELLIKISGAVHHAHQQGIVHRDLKPGNILFNEDYEPLVTDYGLVKHLTGPADLTQSCVVLGTPNYVSPEQAGGRTREVTAATDIYSLGAILFELLTGRPPFVGDNPLDVLRRVAEESPVEPSQLVPAVPKPLENICLHCLERNPVDRYASARELGEDLERWLGGGKISAKPSRAKRWRRLRTHRIAFAAVCALLAVLLLAGVAWLLSARASSKLQRSISTVVLIQDWSQDPLLDGLARSATEQFKRDLLDTRMLRLQEDKSAKPVGSPEDIDPLALGRSTNAQAVLTGFVRRSGNQVRLVTRLLRCDTGRVVWRHVVSIPVDQAMLKVPAVTTALMAQLEGKLASDSIWNKTARHTPSPEAQVFYDRAMEIGARNTQADLASAVALFTRASELDPQFAAAYAMKAFALWSSAEVGDAQEKLALALSTAQKALSLDPDSAQAHRVVASCDLRLDRKDEALEEFWKAVEIDPQSAGCWVSLGTCLRAMGHPVQALPWVRHAAFLEPVRGSIQAILGETLMLCGQDDQAEPLLRRALELQDEQPDAQADLGALLAWQKRFGEARSLCAQLRLRFPDSRFGLSLAAWIEFCDGQSPAAEKFFEKLREENSYQRCCRFYGAVNPASALAYLAEQAGLREKAQAFADEALKMDRKLLVEDPDNFRVLHDLAGTYAVLGDAEQTLTCLQEAISKGWIEVRSTRMDPRFSALVGVPRFEELLGTAAADLH